MTAGLDPDMKLQDTGQVGESAGLGGLMKGRRASSRPGSLGKSKFQS